MSEEVKVDTAGTPTTVAGIVATPDGDGKIIEKLPKVEQVRDRIKQLETIRDNKIETLDKEASNAIEQVRTEAKQAQDRAIKAIRDKLKDDKAQARNSYKMATSRWNTVLKSLEAEPVEVGDLEPVGSEIKATEDAMAPKVPEVAKSA